MKNAGMLFIIFILFPGLAACSGNTPAHTSGSRIPPAAYTQNPESKESKESLPASVAENPAPEAKNADGFTFTYKNKTIYMDECISDVTDKLGEPFKIFEAPSCAFEGMDRIYVYPGVQIHTYPLEGLDYVHTINFMDDSIATPENIRLGSSLTDVQAVYGSVYEQEMELYTYLKGSTFISFLMEDGEVAAISCGLIL